MRYFELHRDTDVSGMSGTGVVADGVQFATPVDFTFPDGMRLTLPAGWCRLRWRPEPHAVGIFRSIAEVEQVHGHSGATRIVHVDQPAVQS